MINSFHVLDNSSESVIDSEEDIALKTIEEQCQDKESVEPTSPPRTSTTTWKTPKKKKSNTCRNFLNGDCRFGSSCRFYHPQQQQASRQNNTKKRKKANSITSSSDFEPENNARNNSSNPFAISNRKLYMMELRSSEENENIMQEENENSSSKNHTSSNVLINYMTKKKPKIPKGWVQTEPLVGESIPNTMLIPLKCPLSPQIYPAPNNVSLKLLEEYFVTTYGQCIGMVIDLCCVDYYRRNDVPLEMKYQSFYMNIHHFNKSSHSSENSKNEGNNSSMISEMDNIVQCIDKFIEENPQQYILIHCTHGLNRTGFVICYYLLKKKIVNTVEDALILFKTHRKNSCGLYNPFFIDLLFEIFDQTESDMYQSMSYPEPMSHSRKSIRDELKLYKPWKKRKDENVCISTYSMLSFLREQHLVQPLSSTTDNTGDAEI
ncbi:hypothetical protein C9374_010422 [Naegleria lovaniensis]|uniref:C3H1-type domain-containing protein n=1 Tax=Naegleria lovaniensis TaxID=51637 RepID=A0AA88GGC6_NAELO|nr:uncharacterized protein C9374_010422 [Naegleria lovaniensis]KAG2374678.1 hypothetical protein C9374_010422 [Naegleria lovaniensis]